MPLLFVDLIYTWIAVPIMRGIIAVRSVWEPKARERRSGAAEALVSVAEIPSGTTRLWIHAASMGEFEQTVPILADVKKRMPDVVVVVTLFSPSGLLHARRSPYVDLAVLLPWDHRRTMRRFVKTLAPSLLLIDRYDLWRNMIVAADRADVPIRLINATMPTGTSSDIVRSWLADTYLRCQTITAVTKHDAALLSKLTHRSDIGVLPDTRIDRVLMNVADPAQDLTPYKRRDVLTVVVGSSWPADEDLWLSIAELPNNIRLIIVPHEPTESAVERIVAQLPATRWSAATAATSGHLVVDSVGLLLSMYAIADAAFVGGAFGAGVHSVTEPAGYGVPMASGPDITRSRDAVSLQSSGALRTLTSSDELLAWINDVVLDDDARQETARRALSYIDEASGSASKVSDDVVDLLAMPTDLSGQ